MRVSPHAVTLDPVQTVDSLRHRLQAVDPFKLDIAIAAAFIAVATVELVHLDPEGHSRAVTIPAAAIALSSLAFRRRDPLLAAVIFALPTLVQAPLNGYETANSTTPFVGLLFLLYSMGRYADARQLRIGLIVLIGTLMATLAIEVGFE